MPSASRATASVAAVVGLVLALGACAPHQRGPTASPAPPTATLSSVPAEVETCAPERLARCIPGLADFDEKLFDGVDVYTTEPDFAAVPPSAARDSAPDACKNLPRLVAADGPEVDVEYRPATDDKGQPLGGRFPASGGQYVHFRLLVVTDPDHLTTAMDEWARHCPTWAIAHVVDQDGVKIWEVAESAEKLSQYQSGDVAHQWPFVTHLAATVLPNGVMAQAWYRTNDPSEESRNSVLSQLVRAAGTSRPPSTFPPNLADWSRARISTLLPPLSTSTSIFAGSGYDSVESGAPGSETWTLCPADATVLPTPPYDRLASWQDFDQSKWDKDGKPSRPIVMIKRPRVGVDYVAELRREIARCTAHLTDKPAVCADRDNSQSLQVDSAVAEGEDTVRLTHRWMRDVDFRGRGRCIEGVEAMRVTQVRGLVVISASTGGETMPLDVLDALQAETVRAVKAA